MNINVNGIFVLILEIVILVTGIQLCRGKWLFLVAGYNTMGKESKAIVNGNFVGRTLGILLLVSSVIIGTAAVFPEAQTVCFVLQILVVAAAIVYVNMSKKAKIN